MTPILPLLALLGACGRSQPHGGPVVVVLVLDGVRAEDSFGDGPSSITGEAPSCFLPRAWEALVPAGARATSAWNAGVTITAPAHADLVSGRRQALANYPVEPEPGLYRPELPSLHEALRAQRALDRPEVALVSSSLLVKPVAHSLWAEDGYKHGAEFVFVGEEGDETAPTDDDADTLDAAFQAISDQGAAYVIANLHHADRVAHSGGEEAYPQALRALDQPLVDFWARIQADRDLRDQTWVFIVSDHGRHSAADTDPPWRHHGDGCLGCRHVPLLVLGPQVRAGTTVDTTFLLSDLAPTIAGIFRVELPWAEGLPIADLFTDELPTPTSRQGVADLASAGGTRALVVYDDDPDHRTRIEVDGERLSSEEALIAEAPALATDGERAWLCFRELILGEDGAPWTARCLHRPDAESAWEEIAAPVEEAGPLWRPHLLVDDSGRLVAVYAYNDTGGADAPRQIYVSQLNLGAWDTVMVGEGLTFPMDASAAHLEERMAVAVAAASVHADEQRDARRILVGGGKVTGAELTGLRPLDTSGLGGEPFRLERPAIGVTGEGVFQIAAMMYRDQRETQVVVASSEDKGESWSALAPVDLPGVPLPNLGPVWTEDGDLVVVVLEDGEAAVCRTDLVGEASCDPLGGERVSSLVVDGDEVLAVVDVGVGEWEVVESAPP